MRIMGEGQEVGAECARGDQEVRDGGKVDKCVMGSGGGERRVN